MQIEGTSTSSWGNCIYCCSWDLMGAEKAAHFIGLGPWHSIGPGHARRSGASGDFDIEVWLELGIRMEASIIKDPTDHLSFCLFLWYIAVVLSPLSLLACCQPRPLVVLLSFCCLVVFLLNTCCLTKYPRDVASGGSSGPGGFLTTCARLHLRPDAAIRTQKNKF